MDHLDRLGSAFGHFAISCHPQNLLNAEGKRFRLFFPCLLLLEQLETFLNYFFARAAFLIKF